MSKPESGRDIKGGSRRGETAELWGGNRKRKKKKRKPDQDEGRDRLAG